MELCALAPPGHTRKRTRARARSVSPRPLYVGIFFASLKRKPRTLAKASKIKLSFINVNCPASLRTATTPASVITPPTPVELLRSARAGDREALDRLLPLVYEELKRVARNRMRRESPGHTLQATALVHEAYLRLIDQHSADWDQRAQFFALASESMRRVLVNHAVAQQADKRGGQWMQVTVSALDAMVSESTSNDAQVIDLDRALTELALLDPQQAKVVELRYFGGLTIEETAAALDLSVATVKREWATARLWLKQKLGAQNDG